MSNDLGYLAKRMNHYADIVEKNADKMVREVVNKMAPALIFATPVDTSRARANWQANVGSELTSVLFPKPDKPGSPSAGGETGIRSLQAAAVAYRPGSTIYIVNNVPYIGKLNQGSSAQAPAGFVLIAILVAIKSIQSTRLLR